MITMLKMVREDVILAQAVLQYRNLNKIAKAIIKIFAIVRRMFQGLKCILCYELLD